AANRRNAQKSTGPRTPEGKDRVRFNALKHGMTATTVVLPHEDPDAFLQRMTAWKASYQPQDDIEDFLVDRAVTASWLLDRCDRVGTAHIASHIRNAPAQQVQQQIGAVEALGRRLMDSIGSASATEHPEALIHELEGSAVGCHWLLGHWHDLRAILDHGRTWTTTEKLLALTLLSKEVSMADLEQIRVADRSENPLAKGHGLGLLDAYFGPAIPADPAAQRAVLRTIVDATVSLLQQRMSRHQERLEADAAVLNDLLAFDPSNEAERLRRYEQSRERQVYRAIHELVTIPPARRRTASGRPGPAAPVPPAGTPTHTDTAAPLPVEPAPWTAQDPEESASPVATLSQAGVVATPPSPKGDPVPSIVAADEAPAVPAGDRASAA